MASVAITVGSSKLYTPSVVDGGNNTVPVGGYKLSGVSGNNSVCTVQPEPDGSAARIYGVAAGNTTVTWTVQPNGPAYAGNSVSNAADSVTVSAKLSIASFTGTYS
jgi:hypothetical protein